MAGADRMTIEEVVRKVLVDEHADVFASRCEAGGAGVDGGRGVRADRRRARRAHRGPGHASQRLSAPAVGHQGGRDRVADPQDPSGQLFPELPAAAKALRAGAGQRGPAGLCVRRVDAARRPARREPRAARSAEVEVSRICAGCSTSRSQAFRTRPLEGRYPYLFVDAKVEKVRDGGRVQRKCVVIAHGVHETGRREIIGLDVGEAETEAFWTEFLRAPGRPRPGRRAAGHLRRPPGPEERDRQGARRAVAALHRALPQRLPRPRPQRPARAAGGADPPDLQRRAPRGRRATGSPRRSRSSRARLPKVAAMLEDGRGRHPGLLRVPGRPLAQAALAPTRWSASTARSAGAPTSSGSSPTTASLIRLASMLAIEQNDEWLVGRRYLSAASMGPLLEERPHRHADDEEVLELQPA